MSEDGSSSGGGWGWSVLNTLAETSKRAVTTAAAVTGSLGEKIKAKAVEDVESFVREKDRCTAEDEPIVRDDAMPWEFHDPSLTQFEDEVKDLVLKLSKDDNTFTSDPPDGVSFSFDFEKRVDVATKLMVMDPDLSKARFRLVPRTVKEPRFWRNYFYRISVVQDSYRMMSESGQAGSSAGGGGEPAPPVAPASTADAAAASDAPSLPAGAAVDADGVAASTSATDGAGGGDGDGDGDGTADGAAATPTLPTDDDAAAAVAGMSVSGVSPPDAPPDAGATPSDEFVMVAPGADDDFESALEAALNDPDVDLDLDHMAPGGDGGEELDPELQRRIEEELAAMS